MEYSFTDAPINNQPAAEPKKESKIKPIHILIVLGALIVVLVVAVMAITIINNVREQQAAEQQAEDKKNAAQIEKEEAVIEKLSEKSMKIATGSATRGEKELYERDALEFINDPTTTGNSKAQIAQRIADFYINEDRMDEAIELLNKIAREKDMTSNGTITCLWDLANIYDAQKDFELEKLVLEEIMNLPDHTMFGMVWDGNGGFEGVIKERLEQITKTE